ncbi:hypothetical protein DFH07DRAFT_974712 [Mycena maculata]|uniref:Uncharacterized protein n=1 Tax=Mycena maculata TaxID=230809 RepID=A0AAD7MET5_9AGAR|nr:hypothetical protein DFH07DRAFT_974712 [Mycena maculata]
MRSARILTGCAFTWRADVGPLLLADLLDNAPVLRQPQNPAEIDHYLVSFSSPPQRRMSRNDESSTRSGAQRATRTICKVGDAALANADSLGVNANVTFDEVGGLDDRDDPAAPAVPRGLSAVPHYPPHAACSSTARPEQARKTLLAGALAVSCCTNGRQSTFFMRKGADILFKCRASSGPEFEDAGGKSGALERELPMQVGDLSLSFKPLIKRISFSAVALLRVYRPRVVLHSALGMGQMLVGTAGLHHLEGYHVQSLSSRRFSATRHGCSSSEKTHAMQTPEAAIVHLFMERRQRARCSTCPRPRCCSLLIVVDRHCATIADLPCNVHTWFGVGGGGRVAFRVLCGTRVRCTAAAERVCGRDAECPVCCAVAEKNTAPRTTTAWCSPYARLKLRSCTRSAGANSLSA